MPAELGNLATISIGLPVLLIVIAVLVAGAMSITDWIEKRRDKRKAEIEL